MTNTLLSENYLASNYVAGSPTYNNAKLSPDELREAATHIVVGKVQAIYEYMEFMAGAMDKWVIKRYVTEVRLLESEKGVGLKKDDLIYARYWQRDWKGEGTAPSTMIGHRALPCVGEMQRIYLARNAPDGFGENKDGGLNVIGPNGFEKVMDMKK